MPSPDKSLKRAPGAARARWLVIALALVAAACAFVAILVDGDARMAFGGTAFVLGLAAIWSGIEMATVEPNDPRFDLERPPQTLDLPQSPVTRTYDPNESPDSSRKRARDE